MIRPTTFAATVLDRQRWHVVRWRLAVHMETIAHRRQRVMSVPRQMGIVLHRALGSGSCGCSSMRWTGWAV